MLLKKESGSFRFYLLSLLDEFLYLTLSLISGSKPNYRFRIFLGSLNTSLAFALSLFLSPVACAK